MSGLKIHHAPSLDEGTSMMDSPVRRPQPRSPSSKRKDQYALAVSYSLSAVALVPLLLWFWSDNARAHVHYLSLVSAPFAVLMIFLLVVACVFFLIFDESSYVFNPNGSRYMKCLRSVVLTLTSLPALIFYYPLRETVEEEDSIECSSTMCRMVTQMKYNLAFCVVFLVLLSNLTDTFQYVMHQKVYIPRASPWMQHTCFALLAVLVIYGIVDSALFVIVDDRLFLGVLRRFDSDAVFVAGLTAFQWFLISSVCAAMTWFRYFPEFFQLTNGFLPEPCTRCPDEGVEIHGVCAWFIVMVLVAVYVGLFFVNLDTEEEQRSAIFYRQLLFLCLTVGQIIKWYLTAGNRFHSQHPGFSYSHVTLLVSSFFAFLVIGNGMQDIIPSAWQHQIVKAVHIVAQNVLLMNFIPVWSWYRVALAAGAVIDLSNCMHDDLADLVGSFEDYLQSTRTSHNVHTTHPHPSLVIFLAWCTIEMYVQLFVLHLVHFAGGGRSSLVDHTTGIAVRYASVEHDEEDTWPGGDAAASETSTLDHTPLLRLPINAVHASKQQARHLEMMMRRPSPPLGASAARADIAQENPQHRSAGRKVDAGTSMQHQHSSALPIQSNTPFSIIPTTQQSSSFGNQDEGSEISSYYQADAAADIS